MKNIDPLYAQYLAAHERWAIAASDDPTGAPSEAQAMENAWAQYREESHGHPSEARHAVPGWPI